VSSNRYYDSTSQVFSSYDEVWRENGGTATSGGFFELSACATRRRYEDIPSRKRAQYRRRYELVENLGAQIRQRVAQ
jgi:uncharacterized protein VirK/YbjX